MIVQKAPARISRQRGSKLRRSSVWRNLFLVAYLLQSRDGEGLKDHSRRTSSNLSSSPTLAVANDADVGEKIHCGVKTRRRCNSLPSLPSRRSPPLPLLFRFLFRFFFLFVVHVRLYLLLYLIPSTSPFTLQTSDTYSRDIFWFNTH